MTSRSRLLFQLADECALDRQDRLDLAEILLNRDVQSWTDLDDDDVFRLLDAMRGWQYIQVLKTQ